MSGRSQKTRPILHCSHIFIPANCETQWIRITEVVSVVTKAALNDIYQELNRLCASCCNIWGTPMAFLKYIWSQRTVRESHSGHFATWENQIHLKMKCIGNNSTFDSQYLEKVKKSIKFFRKIILVWNLKVLLVCQNVQGSFEFGLEWISLIKLPESFWNSTPSLEYLLPFNLGLFLYLHSFEILFQYAFLVTPSFWLAMIDAISILESKSFSFSFHIMKGQGCWRKR